MADDMHSYSLVQRVIDAIHGAWEEGCPVAAHAEETAQTAIGLWQQAGSPDLTSPERVEVLAQALCVQLEGPGAAGPVLDEYRYLARKISAAIRSGAASSG